MNKIVAIYSEYPYNYYITSIRGGVVTYHCFGRWFTGRMTWDGRGFFGINGDIVLFKDCVRLD